MTAAKRVAITGAVMALLLALAVYVVPIMAAHVGTRRSGTLPWWALAIIVAFSTLSSLGALLVIRRRRRKSLR
ncbi:MAG: hypothetical protein ABI156_12740 [Caldimonas sp.]